jgi:hypothetical protein
MLEKFLLPVLEEGGSVDMFFLYGEPPCFHIDVQNFMDRKFHKNGF